MLSQNTALAYNIPARHVVIPRGTIETTAANTVAAAPEPDLIHPGVAKYFREIGMMK
jgi:hypothetical protein